METIKHMRVARATTSSRIAMTLGIVVLVALVAMPWWATSGNIRWAIELCCYIAIAQMWNLLAGYAGLVSVGQQAFIGVAGYMLFVLAQNFGVNPFVAVFLSLIAPAVLAVPTYLLLRRLDGPYFAIGTWVVAEAVRLATSNIDYVNAGAGMTLRVMTQYSQHEREVAFVILCAVLLLATIGGSYWLLRSRHGLALTAMRDNPVAAASQGVNVGRLRFCIFVAAAVGTGLAGAIYYMAQLRITPGAGFDPFWASMAIFIVMVGGIGSIEGAILGALIYFFADRLFGEFGSAYLIVLGLLTLVIALYARGGVWGLMQKLGDHPWFPVRRKLIVEERA
ncbi:leucine/isoleucine/valine transporter permease subunit [Pseudooceanicola marinus]|uniref:Leucine/isoleucine/valine transporter permease subunit n=1 Tax=Pseudooceanicola marinus TaxID=396013 RepID=A0A1X6YLK9_9RHOB|nr:branched-chain amino acid ABC transporter permease [Pseudooceanicola marinus]PJE29364.1 branched-chain amino acid ABC transporter permease [Pseudooceanicola marinus]SLN24944.1 leucine/isoleucine/valine transporter permease subunit [Pseudooceanicola marinus]